MNNTTRWRRLKRPTHDPNHDGPIQLKAPELVDLDFNPEGFTDAVAYAGDHWTAAIYNNHNGDCFETVRINPTHWRPRAP